MNELECRRKCQVEDVKVCEHLESAGCIIARGNMGESINFA